jgi:hypothetical protein
MLLALLICAGAGRAAAAEKNKCGCYKDGAGTCFCDKKAKCGCPGDCEPKGCNEAREKQIQKEIEAETKKAAEAGRKGHATNAKATEEKEASSKSSQEVTRAAAKTTAEPEPAAAKGKKLTPAQVKQLVKLLDAYFAENPDARGRNVEEVRNELSQSR